MLLAGFEPRVIECWVQCSYQLSHPTPPPWLVNFTIICCIGRGEGWRGRVVKTLDSGSKDCGFKSSGSDSNLLLSLPPSPPNPLSPQPPLLGLRMVCSMSSPSDDIIYNIENQGPMCCRCALSKNTTAEEKCCPGEKFPVGRWGVKRKRKRKKWKPSRDCAVTVSKVS